MKINKTFRYWALLAAFALVAGACAPDDPDDPDDAVADPDDPDDAAPDVDGEVNVMSAFSGDEADLFEESFADFESETGIEVDYEPTPDFETIIISRVEGGNPPDIALFPQPGLLMDVAEQTDATPIADYLDIGEVEETMVDGFLDATTDEDGNAFGVPMRMAIKSAIWYPVPQFEEAGYEVPETHEELEALEDQIIADGNTPWCLGMESGDATGWVGTDWVEEYMLRLHGPDAYDDWVSHDLQFDTPEVREAFERFGDRWQKEGNVLGGADGLIELGFGDLDFMFEDEPSCFMNRQGNFVTGFFPEEVQEDLDNRVGVTYFPAFEDEGYDGRPVLAGGDLALMINDTPEAREFMEFLTRPEFGEPWGAAGGWLSPNVNFDPDVYPDDATRGVFQIGVDADPLRFDASDMMPGAVGTGTFWSGIVDWVGGRQDLDEVLERIDESWPS